MLCSIDPVDSATATTRGHIPVLLDPVVEFLGGVDGSRVLDGTFGGGGHSRALLESAEGVRLVALDRDPEAIARALPLKEVFGDQFEIHQANFAALGELGLGRFDRILLDLGLSSFQLDDGGRGFSFRHDAPADMRMNPEDPLTAGEFLETAGEEALVEAIRDFGEERSWRRVVGAILAARGTGRLQRTGTLAEVIAAAAPRPVPGRRAIHPATRSFQGIRIAVNGELAAIERALPVAFEALNPGGRLGVISFHSLEDRPVKRFMRRMAGRPEHRLDDAPAESREVRARLIHPKGIAPDEREIAANPRSRSARLRILEKPFTPLAS